MLSRDRIYRRLTLLTSGALSGYSLWHTHDAVWALQLLMLTAGVPLALQRAAAGTERVGRAFLLAWAVVQEHYPLLARAMSQHEQLPPAPPLAAPPDPVPQSHWRGPSDS